MSVVTAKFTVTGMTCSHCVASVEEEISELDGVTDVQVTLDDGTVRVTSQREIPIADIEAAIATAGYTLA